MPEEAAAAEAVVPEAAVEVEVEVVVVVSEAVVSEVESAAAVEQEAVEQEAADRRVHSEAGWIRAIRSRHRCNLLPASAPRVRAVRQEVLPVGYSPHINACPRRRFRIPTGARMIDEKPVFQSISCLVPVKV